MPSGFLLIDKPAGITSHDVIDALRRVTGIKKIGHAGTLDPFATGLLFVAVGREATREIQQFVGRDKDYEAVFVLGATTETLDPESAIQVTTPSPSLNRRGIGEAMKKLTGEIEQIPPMHSAIKVGGKKLYELARKGKEVERKSRKITVHEFALTGDPQEHSGLLKIPVHISCSSGTYVRALARDLAEKLGTTGYVESLRRTKIGSFDVENAQKLDEITAENWLTFLKSPNDVGIDG